MHAHAVNIVGSVPIQWDFDQSDLLGSTIQAGNTHKNHPFDYAVTNVENRLQDMLNTDSFKGTKILVPEDLYKKYIFFDPIDNLPNFPFIKSLDLDVNSCSEQSLALLLACWMEMEVIYLFGYDIANLTERARLISIAMAHPHNRIVYVRKPNPNSIFLFDDFENMSVMDYLEYQKVVDETTSQ
jgi:hypothetical protein